MGYEFHAHGIISDAGEAPRQVPGRAHQHREPGEDQRTRVRHPRQGPRRPDQQPKERLSVIVPARAKLLEDAAAAQAEMEETMATRDEDKKYLANLQATCAAKGDQFESRQQLRAEEIVAIEKAIEIIRGETVKGYAEKHLPTLAQTLGGGHSLAAFRSNVQAPQAQKRVADFLRRQAGRTGSRVLSMLATRVEADPFGKVKQMMTSSPG
ncbi:unnamed protein product [Prorocentrum cordatum]|uniref:Uncharacterized protein n=1 Tax=Prorocentrum cordatum TaxID=2364126 RepID=A0ABN9PQW3_9DINO|nr:unnamed protein product [Polarella glacialis]